MKKKLAFCMLLALLLCASTTLAEPTPSAAPAATPSATPAAPPADLVTFKSTGERVARIQMRLRELGYFNFKLTGNYQDMSVKAAIKFQQMQTDANGQPIMADGTIGAQSMEILFSPAAQRVDIAASIPFGPPLSGTAAVTGALVPWDEVRSMLQSGNTYTVTDYNTGTPFNMRFVGGEKHAEMECASAADTAAFLSCFGGAFNYSKRPMVVSAGGKMIAASMQGEPHGEDAVPANDMEGHVCVYFYKSLSHVGALPDVEHLNQVNKAAGQ